MHTQEANEQWMGSVTFIIFPDKVWLGPNPGKANSSTAKGNFPFALSDVVMF